MIYEHPIEDLKQLSKEQKQAIIIMIKLLPQLPEKSFKPNDLKDSVLHRLRRVMKRLSE